MKRTNKAGQQSSGNDQGQEAEEESDIFNEMMEFSVGLQNLEEKVDSNQAKLEERVNALTDRLDTVVASVQSLQGRMDKIEEILGKILQVVSNISNPGPLNQGVVASAPANSNVQNQQQVETPVLQASGNNNLQLQNQGIGQSQVNQDGNASAFVTPSSISHQQVAPVLSGSRVNQGVAASAPANNTSITSSNSRGNLSRDLVAQADSMLYTQNLPESLIIKEYTGVPLGSAEEAKVPLMKFSTDGEILESLKSYALYRMRGGSKNIFAIAAHSEISFLAAYSKVLKEEIQSWSIHQKFILDVYKSLTKQTKQDTLAQIRLLRLDEKDKSNLFMSTVRFCVKASEIYEQSALDTRFFMEKLSDQITDRNMSLVIKELLASNSQISLEVFCQKLLGCIDFKIYAQCVVQRMW